MYQTSRGFGKIQIARPPPRISDSLGLGWGARRTCFSNQFPSDGDVAGAGTPETKVLHSSAYKGQMLKQREKSFFGGRLSEHFRPGSGCLEGDAGRRPSHPGLSWPPTGDAFARSSSLHPPQPCGSACPYKTSLVFGFQPPGCLA